MKTSVKLFMVAFFLITQLPMLSTAGMLTIKNSTEDTMKVTNVQLLKPNPFRSDWGANFWTDDKGVTGYHFCIPPGKTKIYDPPAYWLWMITRVKIFVSNDDSCSELGEEVIVKPTSLTALGGYHINLNIERVGSVVLARGLHW